MKPFYFPGREKNNANQTPTNKFDKNTRTLCYKRNNSTFASRRNVNAFKKLIDFN